MIAEWWIGAREGRGSNTSRDSTHLVALSDFTDDVLLGDLDIVKREHTG